jgi:beta-1,4-N-acetylglucosaminyltransferase
MNSNATQVICMVSSSGGHYEQLRMLHSLAKGRKLFWVTERTDYNSPADYYLHQTGLKDFWFPFKMALNTLKVIGVWLKEKPDAVITTGTMVALPFCLLAKLTRKKFIYIESFARVYDGTKAGRFMYKFADLFIYQWETLKDVYPKGVYGGSIY